MSQDAVAMVRQSDFTFAILFMFTNSGIYIVYYKHVEHDNMVGGNSMIMFPPVIADSERDMPGIDPGPVGRHNSIQTWSYYV